MERIVTHDYAGGLRTDDCDSRTWSGSCEHKVYTTLGDKFLCDTCGVISHGEHEVRHEVFPHVSGDYENLS